MKKKHCTKCERMNENYEIYEGKGLTKCIDKECICHQKKS